MGTFKKGILGGFSGKVGTVVGASWRGLDVLRSLPKKSRVQATREQEEQRSKFALIVAFLTLVKQLIDAKFGKREGTKSRFNLAISYHIRQAIIGAYPSFAIDFSKVVLTKGELVGANAPAFLSPNPTALDFSWTDNTGSGLSFANDVAILIAYNETKQEFVYDAPGATRADQFATLAIPAGYTGDTVHCWIAFTDSNGKMSSTNNYLGSATVV